MSEEFKKTNRALVLPSNYTVIDAYFKGLDDQQQKDISEFVKDIEELKELIPEVYRALIKKWEEKL